MDIFLSDQALQLVLAALLGAVLGAERDLSARPCGLRTSMMVALGACMYTLLSQTAFPGADSARIASQVVTGIGFIGGGVILKDDERIHGITTAAHIWMVAAIGMAAGAQKYELALLATTLAVFVLAILRPLSAWLDAVGVHRAKKHKKKPFLGLPRNR